MPILGGGFAGSDVARRLGRCGATIVNPTNFMLYTPLLPEAAAGSIEPRHVTVAVRDMCPDAERARLGGGARHRAARRPRRIRHRPPRFRVALCGQLVEVDMTQDGIIHRLIEGHGLVIEHCGELVGLTGREPVRRPVAEVVEIATPAQPGEGDELPRAA